VLPIVLKHEFSDEIIEVRGKVEKEIVGKWVVRGINNTWLAYRKEACANSVK
jgi:hypothetical protein